MNVPRPTLRQRWHEYGQLGPVARWTARTWFLIGGVVAVVAAATLTAIAGKLFIWLVVAAWRFIAAKQCGLP